MKTCYALLLFLLTGLSTVHAEPASAAPLFAATFPTMDKQPLALSTYRGKPLVVNFWARWCAPCRKEIPELAAFAKKHRGQIEVLGIGIEEDADAVRSFAQQTGINYTVLLAGDAGMPLMKSLGNTRAGLPYTVFVDRDGRILSQKLGLLRQTDLDAAARQLLGR